LSNTKISVSDIGNENRKTSVSAQKNLIGRALVSSLSEIVQPCNLMNCWPLRFYKL